MIMRQKPDNESNFIIIDDDVLAQNLARNNFMPRYMWDGVFYYTISPELRKFLGKEEIKN